MYFVGMCMRGCANSGTQINLYSITSQMFGDRNFRAIARLNFCFCFGLILGPFVSACFFSVVNYSPMLIIMTFILGVPLIFCVCLLQTNDESTQETQIVYKWELLFNLEFLYPLLVIFASNVMYNCLGNNFPTRLEHDFNQKISQIGFWYIISPTFQLLTAFLVSLIQMNLVKNKTYLVLGLLL